ncbi:hypothetical protein D3C80_956820 [compost metagenome]
MGLATANKIYRGGYQNNAPEQLEFPMDATAAGAKPGSLVKLVAGKFVLAATADASALAELLVLNAPATFDIDYAYAADETGFAYVPKSGDVYAVRASAGVTGVVGARLIADAAGTVKALAAETVISGYLATALGAATDAGDLIDMRIA